MMTMLHHISLPVTDINRSAAMYDAALGALGYARVSSAPDFAGYGFEEGKDKFALKLTDEVLSSSPRQHLAFAATSNETVRAFHEAALQHGGLDNGAPGLRAHYGESYYAAYVIDPDGHHIEAVHNP